MDRVLVDKLVYEVVRRVARKLGANGSRETILAVCTGCYGDVERVADQIRTLVMSGFKLNLFFSSTANTTYQEIVTQLLDGIPQITIVNHLEWYRALSMADAVIVPVISMNSVSKLSMLMADTVHSQLMLNAMTMGKSLIIAKDGAISGLSALDSGKADKRMGKNLMAALGNRLAVIESYGAILCDLKTLSTTLEFQLGGRGRAPREKKSSGYIPSTFPVQIEKTIEEDNSHRSIKHVKGHVITASHVTLAVQDGYDLSYESGGIVTPMASDLASQKGVNLIVRDLVA